MRQILSRSMLTVAAASSILAVTGGYATADSDAHGGAADSPGVLSGNSVSAPVEIPVNACGNTVDVLAVGNAAFGNTCANVSESRHSGERTAPGTYGGHAGGTQDVAPQASGSEGSPLQSAGARNSGSTAHDSGAHHPVSYASDSHTETSGASGEGGTKGSPGVGSGNFLDVPVHAPVNACGNSVDVGALLNPVFGNACANGSADSSVSAPRPAPDQPPAVNPGGPNMPVGAPVVDQEAPPRTVPDTAPVVHEPYGGESRLASTGMDGGEIGAAGAAGAGLLLGGAILYRRAGRAMKRIR